MYRIPATSAAQIGAIPATEKDAPGGVATVESLGSHLAGLRGARAILEQIDATGVGQLRKMTLGDSLGDRVDHFLLPLLIERHGVAGYLAPTSGPSNHFVYTQVGGAATFYPASDDFAMSPHGKGTLLTASGDYARAEAFNGTPNQLPYSPSPYASGQTVPACDRIWGIATAHGTHTGGVGAIYVSSDGTNFSRPVGDPTITVTSSTAPQPFEVTIPSTNIRTVRIVWDSGEFVVTHLGAHSTTAAGIVYCVANKGSATFANMFGVGATGMSALIDLFEPQVISVIGRNDSLAAMEAAWDSAEALLPDDAEYIFRTVPQASGDATTDPTDSRNAMIARRAADRGAVLIRTRPYQLGPWAGDAAYTAANAAGMMSDAVHPNNLFWGQVSVEEAAAYGFCAHTIQSRLASRRTQNVVGNLILSAAGNGIQIREGTNARMGVATLVNGTVTVSNTSVTTSTRFILTRRGKNASTAIGELSVETVTASTSFVITALKADATTETGDVSTVHWQLVEAAAAPLN